jgi:excisionase family DNA binding protein
MTPANRKDVLTTGEVAEICHVAPRTVSKWFDSGKLKGYRIPGSRDRRIPREHLIAFMTAHGMPLEGLDGGTCRVLVVARELSPDLATAFEASDKYEVSTAANGFEAGVVAHQFRPHVVVLPVDPQDPEAAIVCRNIKESTSFGAVKVVAACDSLAGGWREWLVSQGFDEAISSPYGFAQLAEAVERATSVI